MFSLNKAMCFSILHDITCQMIKKIRQLIKNICQLFKNIGQMIMNSGKWLKAIDKKSFPQCKSGRTVRKKDEPEAKSINLVLKRNCQKWKPTDFLNNKHVINPKLELPYKCFILFIVYMYHFGIIYFTGSLDVIAHFVKP